MDSSDLVFNYLTRDELEVTKKTLDKILEIPDLKEVIGESPELKKLMTFFTLVKKAVRGPTEDVISKRMDRKNKKHSTDHKTKNFTEYLNSMNLESEADLPVKGDFMASTDPQNAVALMENEISNIKLLEYEKQQLNHLQHIVSSTTKSLTKLDLSDRKKFIRECAICRAEYSDIDNQYCFYCPPCASFNLAKRLQKITIPNRIALVTGVRVKIGYEIGLKLLRSGATVLGTTRFPKDAIRRYSLEPDFEEWRHNLRIYGIDFRDLTMVNEFIDKLLTTQSHLNMIINNAAQTVRKPPQFYRHLIYGERVPIEQENIPILRFENVQLHDLKLAEPQNSSNFQQIIHAKENNGISHSSLMSQLPLLAEEDKHSPHFPVGRYDQFGQQLDLRPKNSWVMKLDEIPMIEMLECQTINATVPFMLNSKLKPLLVADPHPDRYIVNVSAMEGTFYRTKTTNHAHTNMAKAALNMMTRTSGADYAKDGIYMCAVDTGWVTDERPKRYFENSTKQGERLPLDELDGAMRVLDPVFQGIKDAHFINLAKMKSSDKSQFADFNIDNAKTKASKTGRTRKTEKEEDEEMLENADHEEEAPFAFEESPKYITGGTLRDYQIQGLNWMISLYENGINGILADEMGLGKTLQTISFLGYLKHFENVNGPHLVIVPKSTLHNWVKEFERWCPSLKTLLFHGSKDERAEIIKDKMFDTNWDVCITSYEMCLIEKASLKKFSWAYIVIDEAHRIKNENSALSQIVRIMPCRNRLLITGTPLQNDLHELWALLNFLLPDIFSSAADFDAWFTTEQGGNQEKVVTQLHKVLRHFLLRRIKSDVEKSLLPKKRIDLYVGMSSMQRKWYKKLLEKDISAVNGAVERSGGTKRLQNIVMQLRKCCNHPYLFDGAEEGPPYTTDQHIVDNSGKLVILDRLLARLKAQGSRVLLFSQMSRMIDILEDYCNWKGFKYCRLDGQTAHEDRISSIDEFNREGSEKFIFLLTTRAGGLGINLATADTVIMYDNDWNPQVDLQAEDRAHRIGQKKQVVIFRFITENAIEEKVIDRATQKLRLDQLVIQQGRHSGKTAQQSKDDLVSMIQYGADSIFQSIDSTIDTDDIEEILSRSEKKTQKLEEKYKDMGLDDLQQFTSEANTYQWEGQDFGQKKGKGINWIGPSKRERKSNYDSLNFSRGGGLLPPHLRKDRLPKPKGVIIYEHQFYSPRLNELQEKEKYHFWKQNNVVLTINDCPVENYTEWLTQEQELIDKAEPLTEEEIAEKELLSTQGFENWNKRDFSNFLKAQEKHGRYNIEAITEEVEGKTLEEVKQYSEVFWKRFTELSDHEKILQNIERAETRLQRITETNNAIAQKIALYRVPLQQIKFNYGQNKGKMYTEEEDRFLFVMLHKFGYGTDEIYEKIRAEIKKSPLFRFDWYFKSRNAIEIQRRCATLVMLIEKEFGVDSTDGRKRKAVLIEDVKATSKKKK
ncbi:hypothetical protein HDV06_000318 [Boothiomyces sp. JEL0866]|nr:hypothetical protein HDV06_000318 [Boothiomyces sp. JEL0866]